MEGWIQKSSRPPCRAYEERVRRPITRRTVASISDDPIRSGRVESHRDSTRGGFTLSSHAWTFWSSEWPAFAAERLTSTGGRVRAISGWKQRCMVSIENSPWRWSECRDGFYRV